MSPVLVDRGVGRARWRRRALRRLAPLAAAGLAAGALAGAAAVPAGAAAACPNDAYRNGPSAHLPDCRAYELVSPADKGANTLLINHGNGNGAVYAAADGDAAMFAALTPLPGSVGALPNDYVTSRAASGWSTRAITPADCAPDPSGIAGPTYIFAGLSRDFSRVFLSDQQSCLNPRDQAGTDVYVVGPDGSYTWISQNGRVKTDDVDALFAGASADGAHALFTTTEQLFPAVDAGRLPGTVYAPIRGLYDRSGGETHEVGVARDGHLLNICGTALAGAMQTSQPVSSDGRVVFFTPTYNATEPDCDYAHGGGQLFARIDNTHTVEISRSQVDPAAVPSAAVTLVGATDDGSHVFFVSRDQLVADSAAVDGGLYEYDLAAVLSGASQTGTLTLLTPVPSGYAYGFQPAPAISRDGASAYFVAFGVLPVGGEANKWSLFRFDHGQLHYVLTASSNLSADGAMSISSDLSKVVYSDAPTGGIAQLYLYDADHPGAPPTCVSCPPAGIATTASAELRGAVGHTRPASLGRATLVTNDGKVFFGSPDPLVDRDVNGAYDVYEYTGGSRRLLSRGTGAEDSLLIGVGGPDGRDVFFSTNDSLVEADFDNGDQDIYDARVGGGFAEPVVPAPCRAAGCRGPVPGAPSLAAAGTVAFAGSGNVVTGRTDGHERPAGKVRAVRRRVVRGHAFRIRAQVPAAGRIAVNGRAVRRGHRLVGKAGVYRVRVRLTRRARHALARRHVVHLRVRVVFRPRRGAASSTVVRVTVRRRAAKGGR